MRNLTEENLKAVFIEESQAYLTYLAYAEKAEKENCPNVARLFRAAAESERVHATNHLLALGKAGSTEENLDYAISHEAFQYDQMYPAYIELAKNQKEEAAFESMYRAMMSEKAHELLFGQAKQAVRDGKDTTLLTIWVCPVCGYFMQDDPPEECPICATKRELFEEF